MGWMIIEDENDRAVGMTGDEAWDLAADFLEKLHAVYRKKFGTSATYEEAITAINFVYETSRIKSEEILRGT